jgi:tetratricopeptide (TPR) repeat protein
MSLIVLLLLLLSTGALLRKHRADLEAARLRRYRDGVWDAVMLFHLGSPRRVGPAASQADPLPGHEGLFPEIHAAERAVDRVRPADPLKHVVDDLAALVLESPERPEAYYHRARALLRLDRRDEALESVDEALRRDPGFVPARTLRGAVLETMGRAGEYSAAVPGEVASTAGAAGGTPWAGAWLAAHRAAASRQWREAIEAYSTLIELDPAGEETHFGLSMEIRLGIARACLELGDLDGALEHLAAAQALWPRALVPGLLLGEVYHRKGYPKRAEEKLERLAALSEFPQEAIRGIVETYHELEDYPKSLSWAEKIDDTFTRTLKVADMLRHLGRLDEARDAAQEAVRLEPSRAPFREALERYRKVLKGPEEPDFSAGAEGPPGRQSSNPKRP